MSLQEGLERLRRRLETRAPLEEGDRQALAALPYQEKTLEPAAYLVREGEPPVTCSLILTGFAYRHKVTASGERQILSVHMRGELTDLQNSFLGVADHNVQALTRVEVATVPVQAIQAVVLERPRLARALWIDTLVDAAIFREWIVNVGRRDARSRLAHLLCEFALRLREAGLGEDTRYELPMTQEQLADCTGLTPVHVNRVLKLLGQEGLIERDRRAVAIVDWDALRRVGDFSSRYLHLPESAAPALAAAQ